ncbi:major facilitator superfamily domain-containing protein [Spinellus fusiger]|nr:major facilitator superfamily domain-containing protein [Spinellus fusiger]
MNKEKSNLVEASYISENSTIEERIDINISTQNLGEYKQEQKKEISKEETAENESITKRTRMTQQKRILTFVAVQIALFLVALDGNIVANAIPRIGSEFNQMSNVSWVANACILTFDVFQPLFSKISDIFGRKIILIIGVCLFLSGSALSGAAQTMVMLIIARSITGIGSAAIATMVLIAISDMVPLEKRGNYQGVINAAFIISSITGPLIGGSFTDHLTWRWGFYINLPIGAVALVMIILCLDLPVPKGNFQEKLKRIDYVGNILVLVSSTLFLLAINFGGQEYQWASVPVLIPLISSVLLVILLCIVESKYAVEPIMPPHLFKSRSFVSILIANTFFGISFYGVSYYMPMYFQIILGDTATWSGIRLIPMEATIGVSSTLIGFLVTKTGMYRLFMIIGMGVFVISLGLISLLNVEMENPFYTLNTYFLFNIGSGPFYSCPMIALQAGLEKRDYAVAIGLNNFTRILGGALGIAISSAILNSTLKKELVLLIPPSEAQKAIDSIEYIHMGLPSNYLETALNVYVKGFQLIWYVLAGIAGVGKSPSFIYSAYRCKHRQSTDMCLGRIHCYIFHRAILSVFYTDRAKGN